MKKFVSLLVLILISFISFGLKINSPADKNKTAQIEKRVKDLLSKMTLEEKIGQMNEVTIAAVSKKQGTKDQKHEIDIDKLREAIIKYHVGSIQNVYDVAHTIDYWHEILTEMQDISTKETRLKIPILYGIDAIHGATYTKGGTLFPQAINMAATWNTEFVRREGEITGTEVRASGIPWNFYPVLDIGRQPLWSRLWETYGEDVFLATQMGSNFIKGMQGNDLTANNKVAACLKHFVGYSYPASGKDRTPAWISERMLREYFLPTFQAGIEAGAPTVMVNSSEVDGIPGHSDYHTLTEILRGELKFKGLVVSDWEDVKRLYTRDKVAASPKEAVRMSVMAGVDMSMVPFDFSFYNYLIELVKEGKVPLKRIDEAVGRILTVKMQLGLFENPYPDASLKPKIALPEFTKANLNAAQESIVLVKNDNNFLPLSKEAKILVTGPTANMLSVLNGGWTITWQGNEEVLYPKGKNSVLKALQKRDPQVSYVEGSGFNNEINIDKAADAAKSSDVVVLCLGEPAYCESPGNINDLTLNPAQLKLAETLIKTGKPVVIVMLEGRPRIINSIVEKSKAILLGFLPGMEGGEAIADILFGDVNPSAKLPVTYPRYPNDFVPYDHKNIEDFGGTGYNPQWKFGYGLSYTTFEYSNLKLDKETIKKNEDLAVSVDVKNTGSKAGKEVVQLYLTDQYGSVSRPVKQLKGFEKITLNPGETKTVSFKIKPEQLSFIGRDNKRIIEPGDFTVTINQLTKNFTLK